MKVLPIKMPDDLYNDLKAYSKKTGIPMAKIIKNNLRQVIPRKFTPEKNPKKYASIYDLLDEIAKNPYTGPDHAQGLTDDEILYGGKLND